MLRSKKNRGRHAVSNNCCHGHEPLNSRRNRRLLGKVLRARENRAWKREL